MDFHNQLSQFIHLSRVLISDLHRIAYANDASYFRLIPQAVVQSNSMGEIQALFKDVISSNQFSTRRFIRNR